MRIYIVTEIFDDYIKCFSEKENKNIFIETECLAIQFCVGDEIHHIEHGFCDIYRKGEVVGGLTNLFIRMFKQ